MEEKEKSNKRGLWVSIGLYVLVIYLTLPVMRPLLGLFYKSIGRPKVVLAVNALLIFAALFVAVKSIRDGIKRFLLIVIPLAMLMAVAFMLNTPEERVHFMEYGILGFLLIKAFDGQGFYPALITVVIIGAGDEIIQGILPNRVGDIRDVVMNAGGGAIGVWIARVWHSS